MAGSPGQHPAGRLARRLRDRRRRAVADGTGGPRLAARGAHLDGALPERPGQRGQAGRGDGRAPPASSTCAPPAAPTPCSTTTTTSSPSAVPRCVRRSDADDRHAHRRRGDTAPLPRRRRATRRRGASRAGSSTSTRSSPSTSSPCATPPATPRAPRGRRGPLPGGRPRRRGARGARRRRSPAAAHPPGGARAARLGNS